MKILHITDSHGTVKSPEGRKDVYYLSFLKKMYELKYVIKQEDIKLIIHTGDLFHSSKVSDRFTGQLAEIIKSYGIPMYVVPGNHDIEGYNVNTLDQTKLGLLYKTGVVKELDRNKNPIQLKSQKENLIINISGQEYYKDIDTGNMSDFEMQTSNSADFNILAIHGYLCNSPQHPDIICTQCSNIVTDADVILSGHYHESFEYHGQDFDVYNPGSMMRIEQNTYNQKHMPQYGILNVFNDNGVIKHTYTMHQFKIAEPSDKIFDYSTKLQKKKALISLENFKNSISNTNFNTNLNSSIENIISNVCNNAAVTLDIEQKAIDVYHDAFNNSPDKLEVQQGFIPEINRKTIVHVDIHNFQSHVDTSIDFKEGLNAIIGESNSGKTSILRAIRWCLDNDPKGADFITTSKDDCSVTVIFNDNTKIIRQRTRNDSGTYDVTGKTIQPDGSVTYWTQTYKGFANNIPVEVSNIHQMPKINLTKDVSTHLNIMSQLDGPFLVAESPQVKAAIIGRLTGTQIIDLGIKETNKVLLNNSKTVKTYIQEKSEKEEELERYKHLNYYGHYNYIFGNLLSFIDNKHDVLEHISLCVSDLQERQGVIYNFKNIVNEKENEISVIKMMITIKEYILDQYKIINIYNDLIEMNNLINNINRKIKWLTIILSLKNFIENYKTRCLLINNVLSLYKNAIEHNKNIEYHTNVINTSDSTINTIKEYISDMNIIYEYINNIYNSTKISKSIYNCLSERYKNIQFNKTNITEKESFINETNNTIKELIDKQEQIIKDNDICPCCGKKITDTQQIHNINQFMKGRQNGFRTNITGYTESN